jgi:molybdopterin converting factor subunit 1
MARFLFFAQFRELADVSGLDLALPAGVTTVQEALEHLRSVGEPYRSMLDGRHYRVAVNQSIARSIDPVSDADEIALLPPVSGG